MSEREPVAGIPIAEPPSKRRRVHDDSVDSTPRYGSPDAPLNAQNLSIRRAPGGLKNGAASGTDDQRNRYSSRSRSQTPSRPLRLSRTQMYSASQSRSPRSRRSATRSRSPSPSRSSTSSSRSRSRTRSRSSSSSSSRRRSPRSQDGGSRRISQSGSQPPALSPATRQPIIPQYRRRVALTGHTAAVSQVRISPDGRWIASASADGTAKIWDVETGENLDTLVGHMAGVSCVAWAPDSNSLATGSDDKAIRLWDRVTADPAHACGDGGRAYGGAEDGKVRKDTRTGRTEIRRKKAETRGGMTGSRPLLGHHNYVYCLAFSPKGNILASGSYDEAVFLWDVRAGRLMRSLPAHSDPVSGIDFCRDGTLVVSCSTDGLIRIWDTSTGQCLRTLVHEDNPAVTNVCFSPNGRFVLAFSLDSSIRLWDYVSGAVKKTYQGHKNRGFSIGGCFGLLREGSGGSEERADGLSNERSLAFIASASEDGDIVLWDVVTKEVVQRITRAHSGVCFWVDVHGRTLVSAGQDGTIEVYRHVSALPELGNDVVGEINGLAGHAGDKEGSITPNAAAVADHELQRQIEEDSGSPLLQVKEEQL